MASFRANDVLVRRRPRLWPFLVGAVLGIVVPAAAGIYLVAGLVFLVELLLLFFLPAIFYEETFQRRVPVIQADRDGLHIGGKLALARTRIDACAVEPLGEGLCNVQLWGSGRRDDISLVLPDDRSPLFIDALGLKHDRHAARFLVESAPLRSPVVTRLVRLAQFLGAAILVAVVILLTIGHEWVGFTLVPLMFAYFGLIRRLRRRRTITVGADALTIRDSIPLSDIHEVTSGVAADTDARVEVENPKRTIVLRFDGRDARGKRDAFVARMRKSLASRGDLPIAAMLEPGTRPPKSWLEELRRLGGDGYRSSAIPIEDLWRVVEQVTAAPGARIGALAILVPRLDDEGRVRLANLAEGTVKPEVKAALEAASEPGATDEAIVEALPSPRSEERALRR